MSILLTVDDQLRLKILVESREAAGSSTPAIAALRQYLGEARVVDGAAIPSDRVTMDSHVFLRYRESGETRLVHLAWPGASSSPRTPAGGHPVRVSVLSPVGAALIGRRAGEDISWQAPGGLFHGIVVGVSHQPESAARRVTVGGGEHEPPS